MDIPAYLKRINYEGPLEPTAETLRRLQVAHLLAVPFENLSIHAREPIVLSDEALFEKIVTRRRGGFCYELNGLFAALLRSVGFEVDMLSARVANAKGDFGPDFDHMTLLVTLEERWLADVGFGDSFVEPLRADERAAQAQRGHLYRIDAEGETLTVVHRIEADPNGEWTPEYRFSLKSYQYPDYAGMCAYHQTSPDSHFTRGRICSRLTPRGRISISDKRLITTEEGNRREHSIETDEEYRAILLNDFRIVM